MPPPGFQATWSVGTPITISPLGTARRSSIATSPASTTSFSFSPRNATFTQNPTSSPLSMSSTQSMSTDSNIPALSLLSASPLSPAQQALKRPYPFDDEVKQAQTQNAYFMDTFDLEQVIACLKCGKTGCKGAAGAQFCIFPCQDCGEVECSGRDSQHPDQPCSDAWN